MGEGEDGAEKDADAAYDDVSDAKERVPPAHDCACRDDDGLGAFVLVRREVWKNGWSALPCRDRDTARHSLSLTSTT